MNNQYKVYHIRRKNNNILQGYIGITCNFEVRKRSHLNKISNDNHPNIYLMRAVKKYSDIEFVLLHSNLTLEQALSCEAFYRPLPNMGWNIKAGGLDGKLMSEESKQKISEKHKGKTISLTTREKLRQANLGKRQSQATKDKRANTLSKMFKGKPKTSPREIEILVKGRMGAGNPMAKMANIHNHKTNQIVAANINITAWCRENSKYSAKQLSKTANPNETIKVHKGIYAVYIQNKDNKNEYN